MKKLYFWLIILPLISALGVGIYAQNMNELKPPVAKKEPKITKINGTELVDNYAWLRSNKDSNGKVRPEVEDYLVAENNYTTAVMKPTEGFQKTLYDEMLSKIKQTDLSLPTKTGNFWYYNKTEEGKQYPIYCRSTKEDKADEKIIFDQNEMAKGHQFYSLAEFSVSDDGNILAFSYDMTGYRQYTLQFKDLRTGEILPDKIERVTSAEWTTDNKTMFLVTEDDVTKRSDKMWKYKLGSNLPQLAYEEKDVLFNLGVGRSRDKKVIFAASQAKTMTEYRFLPADQPDGDWKVVLPRQADHEYNVDVYEGNFYITTNKNAVNFRVMTTPINNPSDKNWREFIPHNPNIKIEGTDFFKEYVVISEKENGLEYLRVIDMKTKSQTRIPTEESVYTMGMAGNPEFDTSNIRYSYSSMITPPTTFEYDFKTGKSKVLKQQEVLGGYDKTKYETARAWAVVRDGVKVPISIVMKKGTKLDGNAPMLLYAYGSYGISMTPSFSSARFSLVDRGMIYAIAHIRGGGELGEPWRQAGRMFKKINTFNDFVDSADWLIKNNYTKPDRVVIQGGSAGGLLMGAVSNMRPDLFKAVIAQVPFVDVMNTMLDETLPLTTEEWIEWGNPNEKKAFDYMIKYSPYENVKAQNYPNMLVEVSLNDSQVPYWEGAKLAAKIRELKTDKNIVLVKVNMGAGHGGSSGRYDRLKEIAFDYAFALNQVGILK
jgi:oligopeptidase B